jgi:hypothetical protein
MVTGLCVQSACRGSCVNILVRTIEWVTGTRDALRLDCTGFDHIGAGMLALQYHLLRSISVHYVFVSSDVPLVPSTADGDEVCATLHSEA